jgi:hypothetical protein
MAEVVTDAGHPESPASFMAGSSSQRRSPDQAPAGCVFDMTHSYTVPIVAGACANAIAAAIVMGTSGSTSPFRAAP